MILEVGGMAYETGEDAFIRDGANLLTTGLVL